MFGVMFGIWVRILRIKVLLSALHFSIIYIVEIAKNAERVLRATPSKYKHRRLGMPSNSLCFVTKRSLFVALPTLD